MSVDQHKYVSFDRVFREHYNALANYALAIVRNRQDAEDAVQDVFIKMWRNNPQVMETSEVKYYLLTATKNTCISLLRKQAAVVMVDPQEKEFTAMETPVAPDPPRDMVALVNNALSLLPPQCLAIFKMSRFGQLTYQQIADELGVSVKTVENQMGKALRIMRDYAKQQHISFSLLLLLVCPDWFQ
jgi:RNA polymerase sigma-70 factor (family 1)